MILMVADAARMDAVRRDLLETGAPGYTACPVLEGAGRTGLHTGDRVHPGALVSVWVAVEDEPAGPMFDELARRRDRAGDHVTRLFMIPVERQA